MRALVDLVDSVTGVIRHGITAVFIFGVVMSLSVTACVAYIAPDFDEQRAETAQLMEQRAKEAQQSEADALRSQREAALSKDGWGYDALESGDLAAGEWDDTSRPRKAR